MATRALWFEGYVGTYIERDLRLLSAIEDLVSFRRFMTAAALRNASLLNVAQLAQDASIPSSTAAHFLSLSEVSFLAWPPTWRGTVKSLPAQKAGIGLPGWRRGSVTS